jgi:TM2 domain-containing membrane protein YozV
MMSLVPAGSVCARCRRRRPPAANVCPTCGYPASAGPPPYAPPQYAPPYQQQTPMQVYLPPPPYGPPVPVPVISAKSPGIAVLLSIWLGGGQLYVGQVAAGVCLLIWHFFLLFVTFTVIGLIVAVPLWLISFAIVASLAASEANNYNRRNGINVR